MEEITLTGGTLLSNKNKPAGCCEKEDEKTAAGASATTTTEKKPVPVSTQIDALNQYHAAITNRRAHAGMLQQQQQLQHGQGRGACCHQQLQPIATPVVSMKVPPADYVRQQSQSDILSALTIITKMGRYSMLKDILEAWKEYKGADAVEEVIRKESIHTDREGHTLLHWAAKRTEDLRFIQLWIQYIPASTPTTDTSGMSALHWACTEPNSFAIIKYILTYQNEDSIKSGGSGKSHNVSLLEMKDASGCTPLLLAAQHGHVETVAFLVHQFHARLDAMDDNGDSATHWAAYKGSAAVLGLLAYYEEKGTDEINGDINGEAAQRVSMLQKPDSYGQTPLHLASLRGHSSACQYILKRIAGSRNENRRAAVQLLKLPDKNGRTPYELAVHKKKPHTAACLQQAERTFQVLGRTGGRLQLGVLFQTVFVDWLCSVHRWKTWLGIPTGMDDPMDVAPSFPNYYVVAQVVGNIWFNYTVFVPLFDLGRGMLWDCTVLHVMQAFLSFSCIYTMYKCQTTNPGRLDDSCPEISHWRRLYGETLASYADNTDKSTKLQLCHTCHIARPPRSKHDRNSGCCVLLFDHNCPFVGNTIGLYNYKWFYLFLLSMTWYFVDHLVLLFKYMARVDHVSWWTLIFGIYLPLHILMTGSLLIYHTQLTAFNLTTNEHMNLQRYEYLWTTTNAVGSIPNGNSDKGDLEEGTHDHSHHHQPAMSRKFKNPWSNGVFGNFSDRFSPSHSSYLLPELHERLLSSSSSTSSMHYKNQHHNSMNNGIQMV